ncbi:Uncharacterised protein [Vibrio cholerae]|uniref:Uncharacterized protein n=1 Tax=Vibrio cholerae TaxID=666 RepID=A0A655YE58_VIBCL|nr:Uncharacterised protein [Vibrio cholerae]CSC36453.1 Uncharacterised protein [Vibrio cholerae]CSC74709.1 Uncharacterised protein [Vibrio cholerae]CSI53112.1 Uncharacterised protein [Vibrio cholerae]
MAQGRQVVVINRFGFKGMAADSGIPIKLIRLRAIDHNKLAINIKFNSVDSAITVSGICGHG